LDELKISDFGMSRVTVEESGGKTLTNTGPLKWMAPESYKRVYSQKSDVWSFAVTMIEILTSQEPYPGLTGVEVAVAVSNEDLKPTPPPYTAAGMVSVIDQCCSRAASARPSFEDVIDSLSTVTVDESVEIPLM